MNEAELKQTIFEVLGTIAPEADPSELAPQANLMEALDIDSFDFLNVVIGLNERLGVEIPEADYPQVSSLSGLLDYLGARAR